MLVLLLTMLASAQDLGSVFELPDMNAQLYRPPIDARRTMWTDDAFTMPHLQYTGRFYATYINGPVGAVFLNDQRYAVVGDVVGMNLTAGVQLGPVRVGADVPLYLIATSGWESAGGGGLGDIALDAKANIVTEDDAPIAAAVGARLSLPTGTVTVPLSSPKVQTEIQGIVHKEIDQLLLAANVGARFGPKVEQDNLTLNDALMLRLGVGYSGNEEAGTSLDLQMVGDLSQSPETSDRVKGVGLPVEFMVGGWRRLNSDLVLRGGVGRGLTRGIGASAFRLVFSVGYEPDYGADRDLDGIADALDSCPDTPEDIDGYEDTDGCPELDNDADGIVDTNDTCPMEPEDPDSWQDEDGCPEPTTLVRVSLVDPNGAPVPGATAEIPRGDGEEPATAGATFEIELAPGEYTLTGQAEGFEPLTATFSVVNGPPMDVNETMTPDIEEVGILRISVVDGEGESIPGATFAIGEDGEDIAMKAETAEQSVEPGTYSIVARAENYQPGNAKATVAIGETAEVTVTLKAARVRVSLAKIEILDKVYFNTGKSTIKTQSYGLLDEVAQTLKDRPDITRVRIEGHTDSRGSESLNQRLSEARAASVLQYLVEAGVSRDRLTSVGLGESQPIDKAQTEEAWRKNRRVEFVIVEVE